MKPLAIDLFCGLGGWSNGLIATGWDVIGFDIEQHAYDGDRYPGQLVIQDVLTIHGSQFRAVDLIVASPPCQEYSYMAMPWTRAKAKAAAIRADETGAELGRLNALFNACFRIQREACEAAGRHIPMVVENVRGAIPWVGRSRWNFGSFHLWGDLPALMPPARAMKNGDGGSWFGLNPNGTPGALNNARDGRKLPSFRFDGSGGSFQTAAVEGMKSNGDIPHIRSGARSTPHLTNSAEHVAPGRKGVGAGAAWFDGNLCVKSSKSPARKAASARIAKIPITLSRWIGIVYFPHESHLQPARTDLQPLDRNRRAGADKETPRVLVSMPVWG